MLHLKNSHFLVALTNSLNSDITHGLKLIRRSSERKCCKSLLLETINPNIVKLEYAVRGPLVIKAGHLQEELKRGVQKPFTEIIWANIGNPQAVGQKPVTYIRQLLALITFPELLKQPTFPDDIKEKAQFILDDCTGNSVGSYSFSLGLTGIRKQIAKYIENRDCVSANFEDVILSAGASDIIQSVLCILSSNRNGKKAGVMIPIPQYPLYSATISEYDLYPIHYFLNEENNWSLEAEELEENIQMAKHECIPKCIVVINPGNPTGQVLTKESIEQIIKFSCKNNLLIIADEVYQHNIYSKNSTFYSFREVMSHMEAPYSQIELISCMSCSKGWMGECGLRGGYAECVNIDAEVRKQLEKYRTAKLCPTVLGQAAMYSVINPPVESEASYELYIKESTDILNSLNERAQMVHEAFNTIEGFSCQEIQGAMYAFPKFELSPKAIEFAQQQDLEPSAFYCLQLLESTGVCVVPGSGFGQKPNTYHFRTTILPQTDKLKSMLERIRKFHAEFTRKYN